MEYMTIVFAVLFLAAMVFLIAKKKSQSETKNKLESEGYVHIFHGAGDPFIAFNIQKGNIRFGNLAANSFVERPVSFITNHEWIWIERNARKHSNKFMFYMSDVKYFMHEVFYLDESRQAEIEWAKLQAVINECVSYQYVQVENMQRNDTYDFFISHASEDKDDFVRPLVDALISRGLKVWYDEISLEIGDSLRQTIDKGLAQSKFGIVVLSNGFFSKQWTQYELDALVNRAMSGSKVILPVWHGVEHGDVSNYSHNLASTVAFSSAKYNVSQMADEFLKLVQRSS